MYFIWQYPSKQIKVVNSLINVKVDRNFSLYKYIQDRQKFPSFSLFSQILSRFNEDYIQLASVWRAWNAMVLAEYKSDDKK